MAETNIPVTSGSGNNVDAFSLSNTNIRQAIVIGDSSIPTNVVPVQQFDPTTNTQGLVVRDINTSAIVARLNSTLSVALDPGHELGSIKGINSTIEIYLGATAGTINIQLKPGTLAVSLDPGHLLGSVTANAGTGSLTVQFDPGHELGTIRGNTNTLTVFLPDTGHELGSIRGITNTIAIHHLSTGGTLWIKPDPAGTYFTNNASTVNIFTVSGSTSGGTTSGVTLISPSNAYNFKVFAYSLQTTALSSSVWRFTDGGATSPVEKWRALVTAASTTSSPVGTNFAVTPPGYIFATGTSTTLALLSDSGSLVHYSVSYIKETT